MGRLHVLLLLNVTLLIIVAISFLGYCVLYAVLKKIPSYGQTYRVLPPLLWNILAGVGFIWMLSFALFQMYIGDWDSMWPLSSTSHAYWLLLPGWLTLWSLIIIPGIPGLLWIVRSSLMRFQMHTHTRFSESYWPFVGAWCGIALLLCAVSISVVW